jgi:hypothetical protein
VRSAGIGGSDGGSSRGWGHMLALLGAAALAAATGAATAASHRSKQARQRRQRSANGVLAR